MFSANWTAVFLKFLDYLTYSVTNVAESSIKCRAVFDGDIATAEDLLASMTEKEMVALDPQGNTVSSEPCCPPLLG